MKKSEGQTIADKKEQKKQEQLEEISKIAFEYSEKIKEVKKERLERTNPLFHDIFDIAENATRLFEKVKKNTDDIEEQYKHYFARCHLIELEELQGVEVPACYLDIKDDYLINHYKFECEAKINRIKNNKFLPRLPKGAGTIRKLPKDDGRKDNFSVNGLFISYSETHYEPVGYYYTWEDAYNGLLKFWEEEAKEHYPKYRSWFKSQFMKRWKKKEYTHYVIREMIGIALGYSTSQIDCNFKAKWGWWGTYNNFVPYYLSVIECVGELMENKAIEMDIVIDNKRHKKGEIYYIDNIVNEQIEILYNLMIKERW